MPGRVPECQECWNARMEKVEAIIINNINRLPGCLIIILGNLNKSPAAYNIIGNYNSLKYFISLSI